MIVASARFEVRGKAEVETRAGSEVKGQIAEVKGMIRSPAN
jgi:hypothetical protein